MAAAQLITCDHPFILYLKSFCSLSVWTWNENHICNYGYMVLFCRTM